MHQKEERPSERSEKYSLKIDWGKKHIHQQEQAFHTATPEQHFVCFSDLNMLASPLTNFPCTVIISFLSSSRFATNTSVFIVPPGEKFKGLFCLPGGQPHAPWKHPVILPPPAFIVPLRNKQKDKLKLQAVLNGPLHLMHVGGSRSHHITLTWP